MNDPNSAWNEWRPRGVDGGDHRLPPLTSNGDGGGDGGDGGGNGGGGDTQKVPPPPKTATIEK